MLLTSVPMTALLTAAAKSAGEYKYTDISGKWFNDAAANYGYPDIFSEGSGKFIPNKKITRIDFVRLLHKALGININYFAATDVSKDFSDMKNSDTGAMELIDLATTGIIERGGSFNPGKQLDRDLMIHWIMNALNYQTGGSYAIPKIKLVPFKDDSKISESYITDVHNAQLLRLIIGRGNNMFFPRDGATRAEAVTMALRLMTLLDSLKGDVSVTASASDLKGSITMSLTIQNNTDKSIIINHTSGQKYNFMLFDAKGNNVYTWSADKLFIAMLTTTELKPGDRIIFSDTVSSADYSAITSAVSMTAYIVGTSSDFTIDTTGYNATIVK